jgi:hypothetical protein
MMKLSRSFRWLIAPIETDDDALRIIRELHNFGMRLGAFKAALV